MKNIVFALMFIAGVCLTAGAEIYKSGQGVANDKAAGVPQGNVEFKVRGGGNDYGYRGYTLPIGGTVLPFSIPNDESYVSGLRLNLGWGAYKNTTGLDLGLFSNGDRHEVFGINVFGHYSSESACGLEIGLVNVSGGSMAGVQIGLVNYADRLAGIQIGLINIARTQWSIPIINICW